MSPVGAMATAADAVVGKTFPLRIKKALSDSRERPFLLLTITMQALTGRREHVFPIYASSSIYICNSPQNFRVYYRQSRYLLQFHS